MYARIRHQWPDECRACLISGCSETDCMKDKGLALTCKGVMNHKPSAVLTIMATLQFFVHGNQWVTTDIVKIPEDRGYICKWVELYFL